jgi:hypothetical protein
MCPQKRLNGAELTPDPLGFGVRQLWDGEDEQQLGSNIVPGFNTAKLSGSHKLTFKGSLKTLLRGIIWLAIFPVSILSKFEIEQKVVSRT